LNLRLYQQTLNDKNAQSLGLKYFGKVD